MSRSLSDFRIEDDKVVLLSFADGGKYRVNPQDLHRHISKADAEKIHRALSMRTQFIRRVLPPTAMVVLMAGIVGLGAYDVHRLTQMMGERAKGNEVVAPAESIKEDLPAPAAAPQTQPAQSPATQGSGKSNGAPPITPQSQAPVKAAPKVVAPPIRTEPTSNLLTPVIEKPLEVVDKLLKPITKGLPL